MPFNWTALRLARTSQAVRAYNSAITNKAKEYVKNGVFATVEDAYVFLPEKTTTAEVKNRVNSVNDFRRIVGYKNDRKRGRPSELDRVLKSVNPNALDFSEKSGFAETNYSYNERKVAKARVARAEKARQRMFDALYPNFKDKSPAEQVTAVVNTSAGPLTIDPATGEILGEADESETDVDEAVLATWRAEDLKAKVQRLDSVPEMDTFMDSWKDPAHFHMAYDGYDEVINALEWMEENRMDALWQLFNSGKDELVPDFQYATPSTLGFANLPQQQRHDRTVKLITDWARRAGWEG